MIIKERRLLLNKDRKWLAEQMSYTVQTIHHWETKKREPSLNDVIKLSKVLKISIKRIVLDYINKEE